MLQEGEKKREEKVLIDAACVCAHSVLLTLLVVALSVCVCDVKAPPFSGDGGGKKEGEKKGTEKT